MKKLIVLFLIFTACGITDPRFDNTGYFPLRKGNSWTYAIRQPTNITHLSLPDTIEYKIIGMTELDKKKYYVFTEYMYLQGGESYPINFTLGYLRKAEDGNIYQWTKGKEYMRYNMNDAGIYDYAFYNGFYYCFVSDNRKITTPLGVFTDCYYYGYYEGVDDFGHEIYEYLAENIGIIRIQINYIISQLMGILTRMVTLSPQMLSQKN